MKKIITAALAATLCLTALAGCGGSKDNAAGEVNVYNWGEYIDMDIIADFEAETGIKVNYTTFETNEQLYAVLKDGGSTYDVIIPSDYMASRLIEEDMLETINYDNLSNYDLIDDQYKNLDYDPQGAYTVPYMSGTVGIIYDTTVVTEEVTSWSVLFDAQYSGQILMFDNSRDAMGIALMYLGYDLNTTEEAELQAAYELLAEQRPILQAYVMDQIFDKLESGEAAIGPYYAGDYLTMRENNENLAFVVPDEGSNWFVDCMCIPKGSANKENAEAFIDYMCGTDASLANAEAIGYTSPNKEVADLLELDDAAREIMYPSDAVLANCEIYKNLPTATLDLYNDLWTKLKA